MERVDATAGGLRWPIKITGEPWRPLGLYVLLGILIGRNRERKGEREDRWEEKAAERLPGGHRIAENLPRLP